MNVTITTDGGFSGRGIGEATVDSDADDRVARAVASARPDRWRADYEARGADLVRYTLTMGATRVSWCTGAELPPDLEELFAAVWARR